jgi:DNA-binding LytR/AlgR family response regulator
MKVMRIKIECVNQDYVKQELQQGHVSFDDDAPYILTNKHVRHLVLRNQMIALDSIIYIESYNHNITIYTNDQDYTVRIPLAELSKMLNEDFLRISKSVIIRKDQIIHAQAYFSSKFRLTMSNGKQVDVTRTYYYLFRETFGL